MKVALKGYVNRVTEDCKQQLISKIKQLKELDQETTDEILNILKLKSQTHCTGS